jgi:hypothetical protein
MDYREPNPNLHVEVAVELAKGKRFAERSRFSACSNEIDPESG